MIRTVAIPGCLRVDQNARLDQEGQFASIKEPRSPTIKKNKAKEELFTAGEEEQDGDPGTSTLCSTLFYRRQFRELGYSF
jgi:hypothetical protein